VLGVLTKADTTRSDLYKKAKKKLWFNKRSIFIMKIEIIFSVYTLIRDENLEMVLLLSARPSRLVMGV